MLTIVAVNYFQERFNISSSVTNVNPIRNLIVRSALFVVSLGVGQGKFNVMTEWWTANINSEANHV